MKLKQNGFNVFIFDVNSSNHLNNTKIQNNVVLVFGNEANGISSDISNMPFERVKIQGYSECESLNVSVSCGIALNYFRTICN